MSGVLHALDSGERTVCGGRRLICLIQECLLSSNLSLAGVCITDGILINTINIALHWEFEQIDSRGSAAECAVCTCLCESGVYVSGTPLALASRHLSTCHPCCVYLRPYRPTLLLRRGCLLWQEPALRGLSTAFGDVLQSCVYSLTTPTKTSTSTPCPLPPGLWHLDSNPPPLPQVVQKHTNSVYAMVSRLLPPHPLSQVVKIHTVSMLKIRLKFVWSATQDAY